MQTLSLNGDLSNFLPLKLPVNDERLSIIFCVVSDSMLERDMIEKSLDGLDTLQRNQLCISKLQY